MNLVASKPTRRNSRTQLQTFFKNVRKQTELLCEPLQKEDYVLQPITDVSPPKWHLAHTTWFFETFLLKEHQPGYKPFHPEYGFLFNSYYQHAGDRWQRAKRGELSRPTVNEIYEYRKAVDQSVLKLLEETDFRGLKEIQPIIELGLNHEQQHQELLIYDIKYILANNPLFPVYKKTEPTNDHFVNGISYDYFNYHAFDEGVFEIGHEGKGFAYDNETPVQKVFVHDFQLRKGLVTNEEYLIFTSKGGYEDFSYWLDDGWSWVKENKIQCPLYWHFIEGKWMEMTLHGLQPLNLKAPVTHISFYEAAAFANFRGKRLPTEFEWEVAARLSRPVPEDGNFMNDHILHPRPAFNSSGLLYQLLGDVWEWTNSNYLPYHGYQPAKGALGEYNGKFMANQMVLKGGSCATPRDHIRLTYRNFFHPDKRWAFTGIRLAC